jgi:hypothetical protein
MENVKNSNSCVTISSARARALAENTIKWIEESRAFELEDLVEEIMIKNNQECNTWIGKMLRRKPTDYSTARKALQQKDTFGMSEIDWVNCKFKNLERLCRSIISASNESEFITLTLTDLQDIL